MFNTYKTENYIFIYKYIISLQKCPLLQKYSIGTKFCHVAQRLFEFQEMVEKQSK